MTQWHEWREAPPCDYAVLGDPVSHSKSPSMHQAAYAACSLDLIYSAIRVPEREFTEALEWLTQLGLRGVNCTIPLKGAAKDWCLGRGGFDFENPAVRPTVSVNTLDLKRGIGISTDEAGFMNALAARLGGSAQPSVLLMGAGGTAQALARAMAARGFQLSLWNRTRERWTEAARELSVRQMDEIDLSGIDVAVNATSAGLSDAELPVRWETAGRDLLAVDLVYGRQTPFLAEAKRRGLAVQDGARMLMEQGALSFEWWLGIEAPRGAMLEALADGHS